MNIEGMAARIDPVNFPITGIAHQGDTPFDMKLITRVEGNLWTGGCINGVRLPYDFSHVVSLYPWEKYALGPNTQRYEVEMYDSLTQGFEQVEEIALKTMRRVEHGKTLVHCQAGLNRSGLIAGRTLMLLGYTASEAIALLRQKRSPAVLCNPHFEEYLRSL